MPGKLLLLGTRKVHPSPMARLMVPCVLCSPKGQMARLVGMAWVAAIPGASLSTEGNRHQSHCYNKVWAPRRLLQHKCLSCKCSVTPAQMSPVHLWWQHNLRLVQLIWVLLSCGCFSPLLQVGRKQELGTPPLFVSLSSHPHSTSAEGGGASMAFRVLRGQASLCRALGGAAGNQAMRHWWKVSRDDTSASSLILGCQQLCPPCVTGDDSCGREIAAIFPCCWVGQRKSKSSLPRALLWAMWMPFLTAWRSLFFTIFLPPHLFDITYSVWKYCPFCPPLHHLLTQSCVCVWVRSSWHKQEVNTFISPEIADSGRGRGERSDSKDPHPDSAAAEKPIPALSDSARRYQCTAILSPLPALPAPPTCLL